MVCRLALGISGEGLETRGRGRGNYLAGGKSRRSDRSRRARSSSGRSRRMAQKPSKEQGRDHPHRPVGARPRRRRLACRFSAFVHAAELWGNDLRSGFFSRQLLFCGKTEGAGLFTSRLPTTIRRGRASMKGRRAHRDSSSRRMADLNSSQGHAGFFLSRRAKSAQ